MLPLHDVNLDDVICFWRRVENDVTLDQNVILKVDDDVGPTIVAAILER